MIGWGDIAFAISAIAAAWLGAPIAAFYIAGAPLADLQTRVLWTVLFAVVFFAGWVSARRSSA